MRRNRVLKMSCALLMAFAVIVGGAVFAASRMVASDDPVERGSGFPVLSGTNLKLENVIVPDDLPGALKLIVVAYDSDQQIFVDKWLLPLEELNERYPQLAGYYVPLLPRSAADAALPILGGMTIAASSDEDRARTIVVFTDVDAFNALVGVPDTSDVQLFLLDSENRVRWHGSGSYSNDTLNSLENALADLVASDD